MEEKMEEKIIRLHYSKEIIIKIQSNFRKFVARKRFLTKKRCAIRCQANYRRFTKHRFYQRLCPIIQRSKLNRQHEAARKFQNVFRRFSQRTKRSLVEHWKSKEQKAVTKIEHWKSKAQKAVTKIKYVSFFILFLVVFGLCGFAYLNTNNIGKHAHAEIIESMKNDFEVKHE